MPTLSLFNGIVVRMNKEVDGKHHSPHIHASHDDYEASYDIEEGKYFKIDPLR